jgi:hypothetical protein
VHDVALALGGTLHGQVLDPQGAPLSQTAVTVWSRGQQIATTRTDASGRFAVGNLRGGCYTVIAGTSGGVYRLWTQEAAPAHAGRGVLIVEQRGVVRGQMGGGGLFTPTNLALAGFATLIVTAGLVSQGNSQENLPGS